MIYFGIPLRSKGASKDWNHVEQVFNRTLESIFAQTSPSFRVIVACHDVPKLQRKYDDRLEFVISDTPIPNNKREMMLDKGYKVSLIAQKIRAYGGGYTMMVDSDDLVSNRIAEYAENHPNCTGFLSDSGYIYNDGFDYMKKVRLLHRICGSCSIVNYSIDDLPEKLPESFWDDSQKEHYIVRMSHRVIPDYLKEHGRKLERLPFPSTVYVRNTGDNHSMLGGSDLNWKRKVELFITSKTRISKDIEQEYGIRKLTRNS